MNSSALTGEKGVNEDVNGVVTGYLTFFFLARLAERS